MAKVSVVSSAILFLVFVLAISEIAMVNGNLCEKPSKTFSGKCDNKQCDKKCKDWEKAGHGACHSREGKSGCFCYFDCSKTPPSKGKSPSPPKGGSSQPPSDGGSPPPSSGGGGGGSSPPSGGSGGAGGSSPPSDGGSSPPPGVGAGGGSSPPADGGSPPPPTGCQRIAE